MIKCMIHGHRWRNVSDLTNLGVDHNGIRHGTSKQACRVCGKVVQIRIKMVTSPNGRVTVWSPDGTVTISSQERDKPS